MELAQRGPAQQQVGRFQGQIRMATFNRPAILTRPLPRLSTHFLRLGRIGLPVLALDQGMKYWVDASRPMLKRSSLAGIDWLTISRYHNSGMILETWSTVKAGEFDLYVKILPSGAFAILTYLLWDRLLSGTRIERIGVSLFLAGGFSNLLSFCRSIWQIFRFSWAPRSSDSRLFVLTLRPRLPLVRSSNL